MFLDVARAHIRPILQIIWVCSGPIMRSGPISLGVLHSGKMTICTIVRAVYFITWVVNFKLFTVNGWSFFIAHVYIIEVWCKRPEFYRKLIFFVWAEKKEKVNLNKSHTSSDVDIDVDVDNAAYIDLYGLLPVVKSVKTESQLKSSQLKLSLHIDHIRSQQFHNCSKKHIDHIRSQQFHNCSKKVWIYGQQLCKKYAMGHPAVSEIYGGKGSQKLNVGGNFLQSSWILKLNAFRFAGFILFSYSSFWLFPLVDVFCTVSHGNSPL